MKFYEMHFESTDQLKLEGSSTTSTSFSLLCMTDDGQAFCAISDKVYHIYWDTSSEELGRTLCYTPNKDSDTIVSSPWEIVHLDTLQNTDNTCTMAVVYFHEVKYSLCVFQLELQSMKIKWKQEETLHSKPNVVRLLRDPLSTSGCTNMTVFATYYVDPCVELFYYSTKPNCYISRVEDTKVKEHYPGLHKCMYRPGYDKKSLPRDVDHHNLHHQYQLSHDKRMAHEYILCVDVLVDKGEDGDGVRYLVYGTLDGNIYVHVSNSRGMLWEGVYDWEGPISAVKLFKVEGIMCLVGACMVEQVVLFTDINTTNKLSKQTILPESNLFDSVTCINTMDIDCDGDLEILVGTYGRVFLVYKLYLSEGVLVPQICYRRNYCSPIYKICYSDITNDGLSEIIILTFDGIHILQRCLKTAQLFIQKTILELNSIECPLIHEHSKSDNVSPNTQNKLGN